jgi:succinyl-CoA synthetase beta subunit
MQNLIQTALDQGHRALSEYHSKKLLAGYGIPVTKETLAQSVEDAVAAAESIGYPVALKACSPELMHKTEADAIALDLQSPSDIQVAFKQVTQARDAAIEGVLVQEMIAGQRELVLGLTRDPQFGPCIMLGLGGIMTEILKDTVFRVAPVNRFDVQEMAGELKSKAIFDSFRGQAPADMEVIYQSLIAIGQIGLENEEISEIDINPMIIDKNGRVVAADALVVLGAE